MGSLYLFGGILIIGILGIIGNDKIDDYLTQKKGEVVPVQLINIPAKRGVRGTWIDFEYQNQVYSTKKISWREIKTYEIGDTINLKHLPGTDSFVPLTYKAEGELLACIIALLMGLGSIYKGIREMQLAKA